MSFAIDRGIVDYTQLFTATSMMPSHVISDELGLGEGGVTAALQQNDPQKVDADRRGLEHHVGPQTRDRPEALPVVGALQDRLRGATTARWCSIANDRWWGAKPLTNRITVWPRGIDVQDRVNDGTFDVVDVATGSSGTLTTPDDYERADSPSGGIEQLIFAPQGPLAAPPARRAVALCTPRDLIARNAELPISDSRLNPASDNALSQAEVVAEGGQFGVSNPDAARAALGNKPLTVRIGYQTPNARLAATVGAIAKACAPAGITVQDVASDTTGPQTLRDGQLDVLIGQYRRRDGQRVDGILGVGRLHAVHR